MAETSASTDPNKNHRLEQKKQEALETLLAESLQFVNNDNGVIRLAKDLFETVVTEAKRNPASLFSSKSDNMDAILSALKNRPPAGSGVSGGDIVGGGPFSDIIDFISALGSLIADEKKFFLKIIFLIFCGCDCVCKCLCDD